MNHQKETIFIGHSSFFSVFLFFYGNTPLASQDKRSGQLVCQIKGILSFFWLLVFCIFILFYWQYDSSDKLTNWGKTILFIGEVKFEGADTFVVQLKSLLHFIRCDLDGIF